MEKYLESPDLWKMTSKKKIGIAKFPLAPMGVLAPVSADKRHSAGHPLKTSRNFSPQILKPHAKFRNPLERKRRKNPLIVATTFHLQGPRAAHALKSDQFLNFPF